MGWSCVAGSAVSSGCCQPRHSKVVPDSSALPALPPCLLCSLPAAAAAAAMQAGGASSGDGKCTSSLDIPIEAYDQRTEVGAAAAGLADVR